MFISDLICSIWIALVSVLCKTNQPFICSGKTNNNMNTWTLLAQTLLNLVAEGAKLGEFLAKFQLTEERLDSLLSLDTKLKPAWALIRDLSSSEELTMAS